MKERIIMSAVILAPLLFVFLSDSLAFGLGIATTIGMLAWLLRGRTLYLHGAEHRAIAAAEERKLSATWNGDAAPSRFSLRCGTNFVALVLPVGLLAERMWPFAPALWTPAVVAVLSIAVSMELWRVVQGSTWGPMRVFLLPGLALQRLTTREPTLEETRVALAAVASVVRRELDA
jgi:uncharacterized protein YqhQ